MVGLIPLFALTTLEPATLHQLPDFKKRLEWFIQNRPDLRQNVACMETTGMERGDYWRSFRGINSSEFCKPCWMKPSF